MAERKKSHASGDAPDKKKEEQKSKVKIKDELPEPEELPKTPSQIAQEEAEYRAMLRRQRFKRRWPEITKVPIVTKPWHPPPPPQKMRRITIDLPELVTRKWVPPYMKRRRRRMKLQRIPPEEVTQPLYEFAKLKKIWHNFSQVDRNKMMLQGSIGCNSKKYSSTACGSQTACIAVVCRALLEEKAASELVRHDVNDLIDVGDRYYRQCMLALKCYKGKPQLSLNQLLTSFFFHDYKYTVKMVEVEKGLLAKHPDNIQTEPDLMTLMEKRAGTTYNMILSAGDQHFFIWGHPPENPGLVKTVCYIFDPHMLNYQGQPHFLFGAGAFLRYAGVSSFVLDFLTNYGDLDAAKKGTPKPPIVLTNIEVVQIEPLLREPNYDLDLKALKTHCFSEWGSMHMNSLIEKKIKEGKYPLGSLSAVSLATSRANARRKVHDFYQKAPKEPPPQLPVPPERPPAGLTTEQIMQMRGEDFFLYCPKTDGHLYGRDDMLPRPKSETVLHSMVEIEDKNFHSQYQQIDVDKWILRGTRHMASYRYQTFKTFTGVPCSVSALAFLLRLRARAWNEDIVDETLNLGYNLYRESLLERTGPIRRLVLGEIKETFRIRDKEYKRKDRGIAVWGKLISTDPKVLDVCRGIEAFFKESDTGILQIPGELEVAIFHEGGKYYVYHPWPADKYGYKVGLQDGGKACVLYFNKVSRLCEHFLDSVKDMKRKPFSISDVFIMGIGEMPEPVNKLKPVAPNRWIIRGHFHEADERFPEEHRGRQATPASVAALALAHVVAPADWTGEDVDEALVRGDILYQNTLEYFEKKGISLENPKTNENEDEGEEEETVSGTLAAGDVINRFRVSEYDCIETDVMDCALSGQLNPEPNSNVLSLRDSLKHMFQEYTHAVFTARGGSMAIWRHEDSYYFFDPHGCDENGLPSDEPTATACLVRIKGSEKDLADVILSNISPGTDDSFNISPVLVAASKLNAAIGAPETKLTSKAFQWISKGTAAVMPGPRGESTAIGKAAQKAGIGDEDMAGRTLALPAAAAFCAATESVPPPHMHQDHMYNFLDAGADYFLSHLKKTGRRDIQPEDLSEKFEMGANTFSIELDEPIRLPLRLPDEPAGEGEEESAEKDEIAEEEEEVKEVPMKQIKDALNKQWLDSTSNSVSLLVGDYHQLGVWVSGGGGVVVFDPAPILHRGLLTPQRIKKGDELRIQRLKEEMAGEGGGGDDEEEEEAGAEGEEVPEPMPEFVPPESTPALMLFSSPGEFIDKLTLQGGLDRKQCLAPYKLYPVKVTNELTSVLKERKGAPASKGDEEGADDEDDDVLIEEIDEADMGKYFTRISRAVAAVRGRVAQNENYFLDQPNRDHQDAANAAMGIVVEHIEPYVHWKPQLLDAILKYGDRLYTLSLARAAAPPGLAPAELRPDFHVTTFNVKLTVESDAVTGDLKAGETGSVLSLKRGLTRFFEANKYGILCSKSYCVGVWRASDKAHCLWEPHAVGPTGAASPGGSCALVVTTTVDLLADTFKKTMEKLSRIGSNRYTISSVSVVWELSKSPGIVAPAAAVPDEGYECKVLTAYVEMGKGRTILRGSRPPDLVKFSRDALLQSSCGAIAGVCLARVRRPALWTRATVDEAVAAGANLFCSSLASLGYEFRPGEDVLLPLQVLKRFVLGVNYVRYDLQEVYSGRLEQREPTEMTVRCALERFFSRHAQGVLWSAPHAAGVWRAGALYCLLEPHACGATGLRVDAQDDGAPCVMTFTSSKLMAFAYLQNIPVLERPKHAFHLYAMSVTVQPIKELGGVQPPLVRAPPGAGLVPATSKVALDGSKRRAVETDRKHPPGSATCVDALRASDKRDVEDITLKGQRNCSGWLVLRDGTQYLSAQHSFSCRKFPYASRGYQALACSVMAVAMSRVEDVCRWCSSTLDDVLESGDQLYQDSYLHYRPKGKLLGIEQVLRKFYTPGNCVCRVVVYRDRQRGVVDSGDLESQVSEFFREERMGVFVASDGFAVALFRTPRGYYMWDGADRDRYGRAVAPPCAGRARACLSQYPNVKLLVAKLGANVPPAQAKQEDDREITVIADKSKPEEKEKEDLKEVHFDEATKFAIYGMDVTSLRRLNEHER